MSDREQVFYGWYDDASQPKESPTYDPPHDGPCLYCGKLITADDVRTHAIMMLGGYANRSYFYRTHRVCDELVIAGEDRINTDGIIFAMIARNGD